MGPVEPNSIVNQQQVSLQKSKRRSRSNERLARQQKTRRTSRSRSDDRDSSSSSSGHDRDEENRSMDDDDDDDDDASISDRSSRGNSAVKQTGSVRWDYRMNSVGRRVKDTKAFCCLNCQYPVLLIGRLIPCKHSAYCFQCATDYKKARRNCPKCNDPITSIEKIEAKNLFLCYHTSHPHSQDACQRGYTSQRDLQAHVKRRHEPPVSSAQTRLESPHQLMPPQHPPAVPFPGLVVDAQPPPPQQTQQQGPPLPPPLMNFSPMNVAGLAPPPLFDMGFRPANYGMPHPPQQFVPPPQQQYRPPPYPPNRQFY